MVNNNSLHPGRSQLQDCAPADPLLLPSLGPCPPLTTLRILKVCGAIYHKNMASQLYGGEMKQYRCNFSTSSPGHILAARGKEAPPMVLLQYCCCTSMICASMILGCLRAYTYPPNCLVFRHDITMHLGNAVHVDDKRTRYCYTTSW